MGCTHARAAAAAIELARPHLNYNYTASFLAVIHSTRPILDLLRYIISCHSGHAHVPIGPKTCLGTGFVSIGVGRLQLRVAPCPARPCLRTAARYRHCNSCTPPQTCPPVGFQDAHTGGGDLYTSPSTTDLVWYARCEHSRGSAAVPHLAHVFGAFLRFFSLQGGPKSRLPNGLCTGFVCTGGGSAAVQGKRAA